MSPLSESVQWHGVIQRLDGWPIVAREGVGIVVHDGIVVVGYIIGCAHGRVHELEVCGKLCPKNG